jgi:hypothetical protein
LKKSVLYFLEVISGKFVRFQQAVSATAASKTVLQYVSSIFHSEKSCVLGAAI